MVNVDKYYIYMEHLGNTTKQNKTKQNKTNQPGPVFQSDLFIPPGWRSLSLWKGQFVPSQKGPCKSFILFPRCAEAARRTLMKCRDFLTENPKVPYILQIFSVWSLKRVGLLGICLRWWEKQKTYNSHSPNWWFNGDLPWHESVLSQVQNSFCENAILVKLLPFPFCRQPVLKVKSNPERFPSGFPNPRGDSPLSGASAASVVPRWLQAPSPAATDEISICWF